MLTTFQNVLKLAIVFHTIQKPTISTNQLIYFEFFFVYVKWQVTHGTGIFPGSNNANIRLDFFFVSEQENKIPNQLEFDVLPEATYKNIIFISFDREMYLQ